MADDGAMDRADARLAAIRGRLECVGYLPWSATGDGRIEDSEGCVIGGFALRDYSRLAAAAPTDLAYLLGIAEAARALIEEGYPTGEFLNCVYCQDWSETGIGTLGQHEDGCPWIALRRALERLGAGGADVGADGPD